MLLIINSGRGFVPLSRGYLTSQAAEIKACCNRKSDDADGRLLQLHHRCRSTAGVVCEQDFVLGPAWSSGQLEKQLCLQSS